MSRPLIGCHWGWTLVIEVKPPLLLPLPFVGAVAPAAAVRVAGCGSTRMGGFLRRPVSVDVSEAEPGRREERLGRSRLVFSRSLRSPSVPAAPFQLWSVLCCVSL